MSNKDTKHMIYGIDDIILKEYITILFNNTVAFSDSSLIISALRYLSVIRPRSETNLPK